MKKRDYAIGIIIWGLTFFIQGLLATLALNISIILTIAIYFAAGYTIFAPIIAIMALIDHKD